MISGNIQKTELPLKPAQRNGLVWSRKGIIRLLFFYALVSVIVLSLTYTIKSPKEYLLEKQNKAYAAKLDSIKNKLQKMEAGLSAIVQRDDSIYRTVYEMQPIPETQRKVGYGGADRYADLRGYDNSDEIIEVSSRLEHLARQLYVEHKSLSAVERRAKLQEQRLSHIPAIPPVAIRDYTYISSPFGFRHHPKTGRWKRHTGVDIAARYGAPVYATGDGVVRIAGRESGYGRMVEIDHGFGYMSIYGHLSRIAIKRGTEVKRGQLIGYVGNSGISTGTHLHYEIRKNGYAVNPKKFYSLDLSEYEYEEIIRRADNAK